MNDALLLLLLAAAGVGVGLAMWTMARLGARLTGKTKGTWDDELAKRLPLPVSIVAGILAVALGMRIAADDLDPGLVREATRALAVLFVVAAAWSVLQVLRLALERATRRRARLQPAARVSSRVLALVIYALAFLTILSEYGISVTPLLTGLGIAALAVALALQDTLANFFAGIWIQTGRAMQPGHFVRLENEKLEGFVEQVGWRVTSIRTLQGNTIIAPNSKLAMAILTDYNLPSPDLGMGIKVRVGFEADPDQVMAALQEEADKLLDEHPGVVKDHKPAVQLFAIADDAFVFEVGFRVTEFVQQGSVEKRMLMRIITRFRADGIRIPYPTSHTIQEAVQPPAERVPGAPGGFAPPHRRPPRPKATAAPMAEDPQLAEAQKAKDEIAAQQAKAEAKARDGEAEAVAAVASPAAGSADEAGADDPSA